VTDPEWVGIRCDPASLNQKGNTMQHEAQTIEQKIDEQTTGNRLKFKLEYMMIMQLTKRSEEAGKMYDQLIEEFDKLA
jgi:hypothetical protein